MDLNALKPALGSTKQSKRIGRGPGSGHGKTAAKGHKGQKARSGGSIKAGFEGGQMPLQRRLPKRGFTSLQRKEYAIVNIGQLEQFDAGTAVTCELLAKAGIVKSGKKCLKILGTGEISKAITVVADKFSQAAKDKITAVGGQVEEKCSA